MGANLQNIFDDAARAGNRTRRATLRRRADRYVRSSAHLRDWTFPHSHGAVAAALAAPHDPAASRALCKALYRDWKVAQALPRHFAGRQMRIAELRLLLACECTLYRRQTASVAAQRGMANFLGSLAAE